MVDRKYLRPGLEFATHHAIEEMGELQAAIGKTLRWGWHSANPELEVGQRVTNAVWVRQEIEDVREALDRLEAEMEKNL